MEQNQVVAELDAVLSIIKRVERSLRQETESGLFLGGTAIVLQMVVDKLESVVNTIDDSEIHAPSSPLQLPVNLP